MRLHPGPALAGLLPFLLVAGAAGPARAAAPLDTLTVVTLNLWHDQHDWPARRAKILAGLRAMRPDAICLQEVLQHPGLPNQAMALADSLGMSWHFVSVDGEDRPKRYGNAILTPHPVLRKDGKFLLPLDDWRVVAHVRLEVRGREVDVYDTHLHHTPDGGAIRAEQIRDLLAFVDSTRAGGPLVLAGDFNCQLGSPEMAPVERGYADAFAAVHPKVKGAAAATLNPLLDDDARSIDHVFTPRGPRPALAPAVADIVFRDAGPDSVWASDHFGVLAKLAFTGARPARGGGRRAR